MASASAEFAEAIAATPLQAPKIPVIGNVSAQPLRTVAEIRAELEAQLTAPVRWTQTVQNMIADGATSFTEVGPGKVLQGLVKKVDRAMEANGYSTYQG